MRREVNYDEVFDAQHHFRLILDSMARPGKINNIPAIDILPPAGINKSSAIIALALLNTDASFLSVNENQQEITEYIALNTAAQPSSIGEADFIFTNGLQDAELIYAAKIGTLPYPENSATFVIDTEQIAKENFEGALQITLSGPGIETTDVVFVKGLNAALLDAVKEQNLEFPLGVDLILTDDNNNLLCIPRSNQFKVAGETAMLTEASN